MTTPFKVGKDSAGAIVTTGSQVNYSTSVYAGDLTASTLYSVIVPDFCDSAFFNFSYGKNIWTSYAPFVIPSGNFLLLEDNTNLLLEDSTDFLLENTVTPVPGSGVPEIHQAPFIKTVWPGDQLYFMTEDTSTKISISFYDQHSLASQS